ncbi:MAG: hypothetical protein M5U01_19540 [Ardenticatenaceae bacterium]|nr:hypothetical protein [Ardenticatenaceae bacterium]
MDFVHWLQQELVQRGWTQADLVKSAKSRGYPLTSAQLSRILSREQEAGMSSVIAIAHGFDLPREEVFRARGWLLSEPEKIIRSDIDPRVVQLAEEINRLPPDVRNQVVTAIASIVDAVQTASTQSEHQAPGATRESQSD